MRPEPFASVLLGLALSLVQGCATATAYDDATAAGPPKYKSFADPRRVTIRGYGGDAMEPFITKDGQFLLFNNSNDPHVNTNLLYAKRIDDQTFQFKGELKGVNTPALEGVPSLDRGMNLLFISTRSYTDTLSTLYRGRFNSGIVSGVELVPGISRHQPGVVTFDAEIAANGTTLLFVDGKFSGGQVPETADIAVAVRVGAGFNRLPASAGLLKNVNTPALEYAPAISADLLELFFTRLDPSARPPQPLILRALRRSVDDPFGMPERVGGITGFVEAPSLSADGRSLYYHKREARRFVIYRTAR